MNKRFSKFLCLGIAAAGTSVGSVCMAAEKTQSTQGVVNAEGKAGTAPSAWKFSASLTVKEGYDGNVFLQDIGTLAKKDSMVTTVAPVVGATYKPAEAFRASFGYSPDINFYHRFSSEDYVAHRASLNFGGVVDSTTWEVLNSVIWIDGNSRGPQFTGGGDIPAVGGIPIRDRRDATIIRNSVRVTQNLGPFFVRPVFNAYDHDFRTEQHNPKTAPFIGYENYVDRYDLSGGLDVGYEAFKKAWLVMGYRYGHQQQGKLLGVSSPFCNNYHRFLAGVEGSPLSWLKFAILIGPDIREFGSRVPPGFDRHELLWYVDGVVTFIPTKTDTITAKVTRFEQPAFSSFSMYEDVRYDLSWRHQFGEKLVAGAGFTAYLGDWQAPVNRQDWIYTPSAMVGYAFTKHLSSELSYSYDWALSDVPNTEGREFTRHLVSAGVKYAY